MTGKTAGAIPDAYERRARLAPALLALAPASVALIALGFSQHPVITAVAALLSVTVAPIVLMSWVGSAGRRAERLLFKEWGGAATTLLLRAQGSADASEPQVRLWREAIQRATGVTLLSRRQESNDPSKADAAIDAAVGLVRHLSHDGAHPQISRENSQYGFERNIYGVRWTGRLIAAASLVPMILAMILGWGADDWALVGVVIDGGLLLLWLALPSKSRTRAAAFRYGNQLLNAVATEHPATP